MRKFSLFIFNKKILFFILFFSFSINFFALDNLPNGYGSVSLGMNVDEAKNALIDDPAFGYRGDRDVSLLPGENRTLISTTGILFLDECWFQFKDNRLYIITINLNKEKIDYYSVFNTLCKKYGEPNFLSPKKSEWKNDSVIMTLERPLTLKYADLKILQEIEEGAIVNLSAEESTREMFLDSL